MQLIKDILETENKIPVRTISREFKREQLCYVLRILYLEERDILFLI